MLRTSVLVFENTPLVNLAIGRSNVRQRILALLLEKPGLRLHLREIQRRARTSPGTASRELGRLVAAGLLEREAEGSQVYFRSSTSPAARLMFELLTGKPSSESVTAPSSARVAEQRRPVRRRNPVSSSERQPEAGADPSQPPLAGPEDADDAGSAAGHDRLPGPGAVRTTGRATPAIAEQSGTTPGRSHDRPPQSLTPPYRPSETASTAEPAVPRIFSSVARGDGPAQEPRGLIGPRSTNAEIAARTAAIRAAGNVDEVGARAGATLAAHLRWLYGDRLRALYLYGARASGNAGPDSPVELLIVLDHIERYGEELERTSLACATLSLELGVVVSRVFLAESQWSADVAVAGHPVLTGAVAL